MMKFYKITIIVVIYILSTQSYAQDIQTNCICDVQSARNVGILMWNSSPINEINQELFQNLVIFIQNNSNLLQANSSTIRCAHNLGNALQSIGLNQFNQHDYDDAYANVLAMGGNIEQADAVARNMNNGAIDAYVTGIELQWLANVIPYAANGNWGPYINQPTQSRRQIRQYAAFIQNMPDMQEMIPIVQQAMSMFDQMIEEQMVMAACLFRQQR